MLVLCYFLGMIIWLPLVIVPGSQLDTKTGTFVIYYLNRLCWDQPTLQESLYSSHLPICYMPLLSAWIVCKACPGLLIQDESQGLWALAQWYFSSPVESLEESRRTGACMGLAQTRQAGTSPAPVSPSDPSMQKSSCDFRCKTIYSKILPSNQTFL